MMPRTALLHSSSRAPANIRDPLIFRILSGKPQPLFVQRNRDPEAGTHENERVMSFCPGITEVSLFMFHPSLTILKNIRSMNMSKKEIRKILLQLEQDILKMISEAERTDDNQVQGSLRISNVKGKARFYHKYTDEKGQKHSRYISPVNNTELITSLAQQSYDKAFLRTAYRQLRAVRSALKDINENSLANVFSLLHNERKKLITPYEPDDELFIRNWEDDSYPPGNFSDKDPEIYSERGERVRSKSEKFRYGSS